jgi:hypothetical protein
MAIREKCEYGIVRYPLYYTPSTGIVPAYRLAPLDLLAECQLH